MISAISSPSLNARYMPVQKNEDNSSDLCSIEQMESLDSEAPQRRWHSRTLGRNICSKILCFLNLCLAIALSATLHWTVKKNALTLAPRPPYSPLREDGAIRYVNMRYEPNKIFQSPSSPEVDEAWKSWMFQNDHAIMIPKRDAQKHDLPETVELYNDPGYLFYGLGVYHQLHCLNRIRKTFYKEKFYPDEDPHMIEVHKNHCFDVIRQALMCHGDISLVYWWNNTYSYTDDAGVKHYSEDYLHRNGEERMTGARTHWNTDVQCRDINAINDWARQHRVDADKYWGRVDD